MMFIYSSNPIEAAAEMDNAEEARDWLNNLPGNESFIGAPWRDPDYNDALAARLVERGFLTRGEIDNCNRECARVFLRGLSQKFLFQDGPLKTREVWRLETLAKLGIYSSDSHNDRVILGCLANDWLDASEIVEHNRNLMESGDFPPI